MHKEKQVYKRLTNVIAGQKKLISNLELENDKLDYNVNVYKDILVYMLNNPSKRVIESYREALFECGLKKLNLEKEGTDEIDP